MTVIIRKPLHLAATLANAEEPKPEPEPKPEEKKETSSEFARPI